MEKILAEKRINISFYKRKNGALVTTLYLPPKWLEVIGITENERECFFYIEDKAIKISKEKQSEEVPDPLTLNRGLSEDRGQQKAWQRVAAVTEPNSQVFQPHHSFDIYQPL